MDSPVIRCPNFGEAELETKESRRFNTHMRVLKRCK
jgi:hypothetical protein